MYAATAQFSDPTAVPQPALPLGWYSILGVPVAVASDVAEALRRVEETYAAFRAPPGDPVEAIILRLQRLDDESAYLVTDATGARRWPAYEDALLDLLDRLVHALLARLLARGVYTIHAGAVVYRGGALLLVGRSGHGKTTLTLGLLRRGLGLLSDEFAVVEPTARQIVPYRRSLHIRPGTPELIPELRFLYDRPRHQLGGGSEWAVTPRDLEQALPACLAQAAPLRYVLLLDGAPRPDASPAITPLPAAVVALELLRGTWSASVDFANTLDHISRLLESARCARLRVGALEPTLDGIESWLEAGHD